MGLFSGVGNFFSGLFGGNDDDEEKKKRQQPQVEAPKPKPQPKQQVQVQKPQQLSNFFGAPKQQSAIEVINKNVEQPKQKLQVTQAPAVTAPRVQLQEQIKKYQDPGVQDVNNYYANDLKVLNEEAAKGDKADQNRIAGIMQSLDNRKKELKKFHDERGNSTPFKTARELEEIVKSTRGDWSDQNSKLQRFWDTVSETEKEDFLEYLDKSGDKDKQTYSNLLGGSNYGQPKRKNVNDFDFTKDKESVAYIKQRQDIAEQALEYKDTPLDQLNNKSLQTYLDEFKGMEPEKQQDLLLRLDDTLKQNEGNYSNNPELQRKYEQSYILKAVLEDSGTQRSNWKSKLNSFGRGVGSFGNAIIESPRRVGQSIGAIAGDDPMGDIRKDYDEGKLTDQEFNEKMALTQEQYGWVPDEEAGWKGNLVTALGTSADTVATFLPAGSAYRGVKGATVASRLTAAGIKSGLTREAAEQATKQIMVEAAKESGETSFKRLLAEEGLANAVFEGVGSLRDGEFDPKTALQAAGLGATIGVVAPVAGRGIGKGVNKFFGKNADEVVDVLDTPANKVDLETPAFQRKTDDAIRISDPAEKPAFIHRQELQAIVNRETDNLTRYINDNPDIPTSELEKVKEATKARIVKLTDELKEERLKTLGAVDNQAQVLDETVTAQKAVNEDIIETQKTARQGEVAEEAAVDPELAANNPYTIDDANAQIDSLTDTITEGVTRNEDPLSRMFDFARRNTADKYREGVDKVRDAVSDTVYNKGIASENGLTAAVARSPRTLFDKAFMKDIDRLTANTYEAGKSANAARVQAQAREFQAMFDEVPDMAVTSKRLYQVLEDPEMLERMFGKGTGKLSVEDLLPQERVILEKMIEVNKVRNDIWFKVLTEKYKAGQITDQAFLKGRQNYLRFQNGMHSPRIYDFDLPEMGIQIKGNSNKGAFKKRKDIAEVSQDAIDKINANPVQSSLFRLQSGLDELQRIDAVNKLVDAGYVYDVAPNKNFIQLEGAQYGTANGKFMDKQLVGELESKNIFNSNAGQATEDLVQTYRESIFGSLDRKIKKAKTVYSPGTFLGNLFSNPLFFNRGSGVNSVQQSVNMAREVPTLSRHLSGKLLDQDILDMQRLGVKIGYTGEELVGGNVDFRVIGDGGKLQSAKNIAKIPTKIYGGTDDLAKVSIYKTLRKRGMTKETAALRAAQFTQDYGNTGRVISLLADSPVLGQPFARFVPELIRLTKNNVLYNPVGTFGGLYALAKVQQKLTQDSGETPEERQIREDAPGKVKIPFSSWVNKLAGGEGDISLDFPVGDSAINAARALGFNFPQEPGVDAKTSLLKNVAPFTIPFTQNVEGETEFQPQQLVSSMLLRPLAEQAANEDFMGRYVDDPTNDQRGITSDGDETKYSDELTGEQKLFNRARHLAMNWLPGSNEADAVLAQSGTLDELTGAGELEKEQDYYGKNRGGVESLFRAFGVKVESNDEEAREARVDKDEYFNQDLPATQAFLRENPDLRDAYWNIKSSSKDRNSLVKSNDIISPEKWTEIKNDTSGRLLKFLGEQEMRIAKRSIEENRIDPTKPIKPIDPIHGLPEDLKNAVIDIKSKPTGDDEAEDILEAESARYRQYKQDAADYFEKNEAYYDSLDFESTSKDNPRVKSYYEIEYPVTPPLIEEYFTIREKLGEDAAKNFSDNAGDALSEQFDIWGDQRLAYTNKKRAIEGYPPISKEVWDNKTYGYTKDKTYGTSGSGSGRSGGSGSSYDSDLLGRLSNFTAGAKRFEDIQPGEEVTNDISRLFAGLKAGKGGRSKPKLGASSSGRG